MIPLIGALLIGIIALKSPAGFYRDFGMLSHLPE